MCGLPDCVSYVFFISFKKKTYCVSTHTHIDIYIYINLALRSCSLSSQALILFSSTARNVLVLCEVSTYANRPVMWKPKYDDSIRSSCQTLALDGFERIIGRE